VRKKLPGFNMSWVVKLPKEKDSESWSLEHVTTYRNREEFQTEELKNQIEELEGEKESSYDCNDDGDDRKFKKCVEDRARANQKSIQKLKWQLYHLYQKAGEFKEAWDLLSDFGDRIFASQSKALFQTLLARKEFEQALSIAEGIEDPNERYEALQSTDSRIPMNKPEFIA
jgi:hypothetical protein